MRPRIFYVHLAHCLHTPQTCPLTYVTCSLALCTHPHTYATYTYARLCMCVTHCAAIEMRDFFKISHRPKGL